MTTYEVSGLSELGEAFDRAPRNLAAAVRAVMVKGAVNIKKTMVADMEASEHFHPVAHDINFDTFERDDEFSAEIGPRVGLGAGHAGGLAWIAYFGAANGGGGSVRDPIAAADEEQPNLVKNLQQVLDEVFS